MLEFLLEGSSAAFFCDDNSSGSRSELRGPGFGWLHFAVDWFQATTLGGQNPARL